MREKFSENIYRSYFLLIAAAFLLTACGNSTKTAVRELVPRETLVYLETGDVAELLDSLTKNQAFQTLAAEKPDFSALENVQMAIAVTGFETSEKDSALNLKPRFVVVADTHLWNWQVISLAENQLDGFVGKNYGAAAKRETIEKNGGVFFTWTAEDERQVFAFVQNSLIFFGNDAAAIEACLAVKRGAAESLRKNEFFARAYSENNAAFGYVSTEGIAQIAALAGVSVAVNEFEEANERNFIARVLPQILRNTTQEIVWTAQHTERGIEDRYSVVLKPETNAVLQEFPAANAETENNFADFLPDDVFSATRYNLKNPLSAWRSSILLTAQKTDPLSGKILNELSDKLLEPYGISEAETFLNAVDSPLITAQFDAEGEQTVTMAAIRDSAKLKTSISKEIDFKPPPERQFGAEIWFSEDKSLAAAFVGNKLILGGGASVLKCLQIGETRSNGIKNSAFQKFAESRAVAATFGKDSNSAENVVKVLNNKKTENRRLATFYTTETRLTEKGFERVTVSDFGFIGAILEKLN